MATQFSCYYIASIILCFFISTSQAQDFLVKTLFEKYNSTFYRSLSINIDKVSSSVTFKYNQDVSWVKLWKIAFEQKLQIFEVIYLGEIDLGEPSYYHVCFLTDYNPSKDFAPSFDDFVNLKQVELSRQYQIPKIELAKEKHVFDRVVSNEQLHLFGSLVNSSCSLAHAVYTTEHSALKIATSLQQEQIPILKTQSSLQLDQFPFCFTVHKDWAIGCLCKNTVEIDWLPCQQCISTSCRPSTCKQTFQFTHLVNKKELCFTKLNRI